MKTRYVVLFFLSFILFANVSCDEDDANNNNEPEQTGLTNENNLYEGDLFRLYLTDIIASTNSDILIVEALLDLDPNNDELDAQLASLNETKLGLEGEAETQDGVSITLGGIPRIPIPRPTPPNPCIAGAACIPNLTDHFTIADDIASLLVQFQNPDTQEIIETININEFTPYPDFNNLISVTGMNLSNYTGALTISVTRTYTNNIERSYTMNSFVFQP